MTQAPGTEDHWSNTAGERFRRICWHAPAGAETLILFVHGLGGHAGRCDTYAQHMAGLHAQVWSYDQRGHGHSDGRRGDAAGIEQLAADLAEISAALLVESGASKLVYIGHSMGAAVVGWLLTQRGAPAALQAVVLSAAPLKVEMTFAMRVKRAGGRVLNRVVPSLLMSNELDPRHISSVPEEVERYIADPLVHDRLSIRLGLSILKCGPRVLSDADGFSVPVLLLHGGEDRISTIAGTRALLARLDGKDAHLIELPGLRHEVHHEAPDRVARLMAEVRDWISERVGRA